MRSNGGGTKFYSQFFGLNKYLAVVEGVVKASQCKRLRGDHEMVTLNLTEQQKNSAVNT